MSFLQFAPCRGEANEHQAQPALGLGFIETATAGLQKRIVVLGLGHPSHREAGKDAGGIGRGHEGEKLGLDSWSNCSTVVKRHQQTFFKNGHSPNRCIASLVLSLRSFD